MPKYLTKTQQKKADKVIELLLKLSEEGVTFYMNSMPSLEIGFMRNGEDVSEYDEFFDFINFSDDSDMYYSPAAQGLKLESYGA